MDDPSAKPTVNKLQEKNTNFVKNSKSNRIHL